MIELVSGNFFEYTADIRVNTVNCVGVMGAGVALEFKNRYPDMFKAYVEVCKNNGIAPGNPHVWEEYDLFSSCIIINLPTKIHWKNPSEYEYIEKDLIWLRDFLVNREEDCVVTLPALGCGHGGLNWNIVFGMISHYLDNIRCKILVFEPSASNKSLNNMSFVRNLEKQNIETIYPTDKLYPKQLKSSFNRELYCKGNTCIFEHNKISLVFWNNISEKEVSAITKTLEELPKDKYAFVLGINNKNHVFLAKSLLNKGYMMVLIIPYGILNYKIDIDIKEYYEHLMIVSYVKPNQEFKRYEYLNSLKIRLAISDVILNCSENYEDIIKVSKYLKGYTNIFYINYWKETIEVLYNLGARKVGLNPETKKPNVLLIQQYIEFLNNSNL